MKQEGASITAPAEEDVKNDDTIMTPLGEVKQQLQKHSNRIS